MSGAFTIEDKSGEIIYASSPGMENDTSSKTGSAKKSKASSKKASKKPLIDFFQDLSNSEEDPIWAERFEKMAINKFPPKISWIPSLERSDIYGQLMYKNRQNSQPLVISKEDSIDQIKDEIKFFIRNYTSIDTENIENEDESEVKVYDKSNITPIPWNKLSSKDHKDLLAEYMKGFSYDNNLSKKEAAHLFDNVLLFAMGKNILPYLTFDDNGKIESINGLIYQDSDGSFKIKI